MDMVGLRAYKQTESFYNIINITPKVYKALHRAGLRDGLGNPVGSRFIATLTVAKEETEVVKKLVEVRTANTVGLAASRRESLSHHRGLLSM